MHYINKSNVFLNKKFRKINTIYSYYEWIQHL